MAQGGHQQQMNSYACRYTAGDGCAFWLQKYSINVRLYVIDHLPIAWRMISTVTPATKQNNLNCKAEYSTLGCFAIMLDCLWLMFLTKKSVFMYKNFEFFKKHWMFVNLQI